MSLWERTWRSALAAILVRRGSDRKGETDDGPTAEPDTFAERELPEDQGAEGIVAALLFGAGLAGIAFVVVYAFFDADTQLLGIAIAVGLALLAAAAIIAGSRIVPQEEVAEERPDFAVPEDEQTRSDQESTVEREVQTVQTAELIDGGADGVTRRRLLKAAGGAAGVGIGAAALTPLASLGPAVGDRLAESPWKDGVALVEENGLPVKADDLETGSYLTAFAKGADKRQIATDVMLVRVDPAELELPADRADWAPEGLMAYSKTCTHAQCAVSLFRYPLFRERSPGPALVCPCHYSTFDVLKGGERIFGPAVRPLPQLPLRIEGGLLVAAGPLSGAVGPSWSRVREES